MALHLDGEAGYIDDYKDNGKGRVEEKDQGKGLVIHFSANYSANCCTPLLGIHPCYIGNRFQLVLGHNSSYVWLMTC